MNSGKATVVPLVASEKNVDACVVSSLCDHVYDDCTERPLRQARRASRISARYQESPSLLFSSIVPKAVLGRGRPAAKNGRPPGPGDGAGIWRWVLRWSCAPREPA